MLIGWDAFLVLLLCFGVVDGVGRFYCPTYGLDVVDGVRGLGVQGERLACERLDTAAAEAAGATASTAKDRAAAAASLAAAASS